MLPALFCLKMSALLRASRFIAKLKYMTQRLE
jgi:hypothetical protein